MVNNAANCQCILFVSSYSDRKRLAALTAAGFNVVTASDSEEAMRKLYECRPVVVIMTDDLAPVGGKQLHVRLREMSTIPCIVLGDRDNVGRARMIEEGADVYLHSSVKPRTLIAYIRSMQKHCRPGPDEPSFHPEEKEVEMGNSRTKLTATEFRLLSCFAFNRGMVLSYTRLLAEVWGKEATLELVHQYVRRLKHKLGLDSVGPYRLLNYRGEGYCFCADAVTST
jgi:DNA-binding response OmpR family regulator